MTSEYIIKGVRARNNLSQEDVAKKIGVSRQTYNGMETNIDKLNVSEIMKILKATNCNNTDIDMFFNALRVDYLSIEGDEK